MALLNMTIDKAEVHSHFARRLRTVTNINAATSAER